MICPCCSSKQYADCCQPLIDNGVAAQSPEALMRSRYTAAVLKHNDYFYDTYAKIVRDQLNKADIEQWTAAIQFFRLDVLSVEIDGSNSQQGFVEFIAHYFEDRKHAKIHEKSRFIIEDQQWRYIDGLLIPHDPYAIGRNDECPCLSGKKFKQCHG